MAHGISAVHAIAAFHGFASSQPSSSTLPMESRRAEHCHSPLDRRTRPAGPVMWFIARHVIAFSQLFRHHA